MPKALMLLFFFLAASFEAVAADIEYIRTLYTEIPRQYVRPVTVEKVATAFLKGIEAVDGNLKIGDDADKVSLYYKGRLCKSLRKPQNREDVSEWVVLSDKFMRLAAELSPEAFRRDFEMPDLMAEQMIKIFDGDSKFYFNAENMLDKRLKHQRNFASRRDGKILYLKILAFNNYTVENIRKAISENNNATGMVIDLRGSPGGQLGAAVEAADLFLDEGIVVSTKGREDGENVFYNSTDGDIWNGKPIVLLTDGATASSAEVLAAALQEQGRAKVIGTGTFGKGTIQNLIYPGSGAVISLTNAYFYTPSGRKLNKQGVIPDICTFEMPESKNIDALLRDKSRNCPPEERENVLLELKAAEKLL